MIACASATAAACAAESVAMAGLQTLEQTSNCQRLESVNLGAFSADPSSSVLLRRVFLFVVFGSVYVFGRTSFLAIALLFIVILLLGVIQLVQPSTERRFLQ